MLNKYKFGSKFIEFLNKSKSKKDRCDYLVNDMLEDGKPAQEEAYADINTCVTDWERDKDVVYIQGISLRKIYGYLKYDPESRKNSTTNTGAGESIPKANQLINIWDEYIFKNFTSNSEKEQSLAENCMSRYMHQGGFLHILQFALVKHLSVKCDQGITLSSKCFKNLRIDINVINNKITMKHAFDVVSLNVSPKQYDHVNKILPNSLKLSGDKEDVTKIVSKSGKILMSAEGYFELVGDKFSVSSVFLTHNNKFTPGLFSQNYELDLQKHDQKENKVN